MWPLIGCSGGSPTLLGLPKSDSTNWIQLLTITIQLSACVFRQGDEGRRGKFWVDGSSGSGRKDSSI